jgi:glycosyltransferase involved in cell wall biosynthesis
MKVLVVTNMAPFVWGGAEELALHLQENLRIAGHEAEVLRIPFKWEPASLIVSQMLMVCGFELWNVDHVIALKFPAYLIRHPRKTLWLVHQYRQAYDLYDADQSGMPVGKEGDEIRRVILKADEESFSECRRLFTISEVTRQRLLDYNGIEAEALLYPLNDPDLFAGGPSEGYILASGRVNGMKRQHLLLEALALAPSGIKLVIAGPPDASEDADRLLRLVEKLGLSDRVKLDLRFLPRSELASYVNHALAVACVPYDEDALSYVAMEAAAAGKALISACDSGGVLGLAKHLQTGWVAKPLPDSLADAFAQAGANPDRTRQLGLAARQLWTDLQITWPKTIDRLLS